MWTPNRPSAAQLIWKTFLFSTLFWLLGISPGQAQYVLGQYVDFIPGFTNSSTNPTLTNVTIIDTLPSDLTYVSCSGAPCGLTGGGAVVWNVGNVPPGVSVAVTVTVQISTCNTNMFLDKATFYYGSPPVAAPTPVPASYTVACNTNTPTYTPTITFTPTLTPTPTITYTPSATYTPTISPTPTLTWTPTHSFTPTITPTPTDTFTPTLTPTVTDTFTPTPTFTPTCPINVWPDPYSVQYALDHSLKFSCLPPGAQVFIYTLSGEEVNQVPASGGTTEWRGGKNRNGTAVSPGIYFYVIQNGQSVLKQGKFLITP